jgi:pyruvate,water dikinase
LSSWTSDLGELRLADAGAYGGKSASLGELLAAGIPVPEGFALSTTAFTETIAAAGLEPLIAAELAAIEPGDVDALAAASRTIRGAVAAIPVPEPIAQELLARYAGLGEDSPPVAVRSSAIGEDSQAATFAGQQDTYLWVRGAEALLARVRDCWSSLYTTAALSYRAHLGDGASPAMGVTVQRMVDAAVAGVMFTCNPVSGDPSMVAVNASWGLGEAVVGGEVTPDEYLLSKVTGELVRRRIGDKALQYTPAPEGGTARSEVEPERRATACLGADELAALLELAGRVQRHFGSHQDIEWAIARGAEPPAGVAILQARPVTAAPAPAPAPAGSALSLVMGTFGVKGSG